MSELRWDATTEEWVILAGERAHRPSDTPGAATGLCPFCPGNEHLTPPELFRVAENGGDWLIRVVPNRFPLVEPTTEAPHAAAGFTVHPAIGHHEVVIESPDHDWDLTTGAAPEIRRVLTTYRARYRALRGQAEVVVIFRNRGAAAGTSLRHPHTQIVAVPYLPTILRRMMDVAQEYREGNGRDLYRDLIEREIADGRRLISRTPGYVTFAPFAATIPYETWIVPRTLAASFGDAGDDELDDLAEVLRLTLAALRTAIGDVSYHLAILSAPQDGEDGASYPWHVRLLPRLTTPGGYEVATGAAVNTHSPEDCAARLRAVIHGR